MGIQKKTLEMTRKNAISAMKQSITAFEHFEFPKGESLQFSLENIDSEELIKKFPIGEDIEDYIYMIKVIGKGINNSKCYDFLSNKKTEQNDTKDYPRLNPNNKGTQYLYVGRSHKLRNRIRQHLGDGYKGTYAMHMKRWLNDPNIKIELLYYKFQDIENSFIQALEDAMWDQLKPCFGRKGAK